MRLAFASAILYNDDTNQLQTKDMGAEATNLQRLITLRLWMI